MVRVYLLASLLLTTSLPGFAAPPSKADLVGTWRLTSVISRPLKGAANPAAFGRNPTGFATFTANGRLTIVMADDGRKPLSVVDRVSAPEAERAEAFATFVAYAGRYTVEGDKVIFHIQAASIQNWVNKDLTRIANMENHHLSLRTLTTLKGGVLQTIETDWQKID